MNYHTSMLQMHRAVPIGVLKRLFNEVNVCTLQNTYFNFHSSFKFRALSLRAYQNAPCVETPVEACGVWLCLLLCGTCCWVFSFPLSSTKWYKRTLHVPFNTIALFSCKILSNKCQRIYNIKIIQKRHYKQTNCCW